jgi:hypothetical protein
MAMTRDNVLVLQARDVLCRLMREQGTSECLRRFLSIRFTSPAMVY